MTEEIPTPDKPKPPTPKEVLEAAAKIPAKIKAKAKETGAKIKAALEDAKVQAAEQSALKAAAAAKAKEVKVITKEQKGFREEFDLKSFVEETEAEIAALKEEVGEKTEIISVMIAKMKERRWLPVTYGLTDEVVEDETQ